MANTNSYNSILDEMARGRWIGRRGVDKSLDPIIPRPEEVNGSAYMESLAKKGVRYRRTLFMLTTLLQRSMENGGVTLLTNQTIKDAFEYYYKTKISTKQIHNILKKLEKDKQIGIINKKFREYKQEKNWRPKYRFGTRRIVYVWSTFYYGKCRINTKVATVGAIPDLRDQVKKIPLKYKVDQSTLITYKNKYNKNKETVEYVQPAYTDEKDAIKKGLMHKWFFNGMGVENKTNGRTETLLWEFRDIVAYRNQGYPWFLKYLGTTQEYRQKKRKIALSSHFKPKKGKTNESISVK